MKWIGWREARADAREEVGSRVVTHKVDLNTASVRELERLPGMAPEVVERVRRNRPYRTLDELIARKVLGRKEFARIKERIRVSSPQAKNSAP
ncbi:MAG: helix-hairpin-helix domain-containing protein [Kofleriaceae bacterium]|nr:helix-hairpin-helix domain-containing protein [Candidatus Methylomirabilis lanthanidiphila]